MKKTCRSKPTEATVHQQVVNYLKLQYPKVLFRTDFAAGIKMTIGQAMKHKKLQWGSKWPDLFIAAKSSYGNYSGLFLEIKRDKSEVYKKDGTMKNDIHIQDQLDMLVKLCDNGFVARFACGFLGAKQIIDEYLKP